MKIIYTQQPIPNQINKSIFLAGPSFRPDQEGISWRIQALQILESLGYDGYVFVPEYEDGIFDEDFNWDHQVRWETKCLKVADHILFHINRDLDKGLMGLTTNDEWGYWKDSGKCVLSVTPTADKTEYQKFWAKELKVPMYMDLFHSISHIIEDQNSYSEPDRVDGERFIPLEIWGSNQFKQWYKDLKSNGNWISDAKILNIYRIPSNNKMFAFSLWCSIYIESEKRYKNNEFFFSRPDISTCVLYYPNENIMDTDIVLIEEFRTPVSNSKGKVFELPGGSSFKPDEDPFQIVIEEISEECGFNAIVDKVEEVDVRQIFATLISSKIHLYKYELSFTEFQKIKSNVGQVFGNIQDTEMTYVHIYKLQEIIDNDYIDFTNLGMIFNALKK